MKIAGDYEYEHPRAEVWDAILDVTVLSKTLPGCEDLRGTGENEFAGKLKMKVGPVQGVFEGEVQLTDLDPPNSYNLNLKGKGAPGFVNGNGSIRLEPNGSGTKLFYDIEAQVGGRIAAVGQRLIDSSAKVITKQGLEGLGRQLDLRAAAKSESDSTEDSSSKATESARERPAAEAPTQAELAREVAKGVAADLIPAAMRPILWIAALILIVAVVAIVLRAL